MDESRPAEPAAVHALRGGADPDDARGARETAPPAGRRAPTPAEWTLELLMEAKQAVLSELSLQPVLRRIVVSARELVGARYAALGVIGPDGDLEEFVHAGMDEETVASMAHLPTGRGLLGVLIDEPHPLRLDHIPQDPRRAGFPEHHPPMQSFLGVPLKVRDTIYGNLYLTEAATGAFTAEDEATIQALGVAAGIAIENARLYEDSRRRQQWAEAAAEITGVLLDPARGTDAVGLVADTVLRLAGADVVSVVVPEEDGARFRVQLARGDGASDLEGSVYPAERSVAARALRTGYGIRVGSTSERERFAFHQDRVMALGSVVAVPLHGSIGSHGVLVAARRRGRTAFDAVDLEMSESFAAQAAIALELAQARADQQRLEVLEDRERIARDLHDHVIQRLFAAGLSLEGTAGTLDADPAARIRVVADELDVTIRQIRTVIFQLQSSGAERSLRAAVLQVVSDVAPALGLVPDVAFRGPVDTTVGPAVVEDVVAVVREGLSNAARHASAGRVSLLVEARGSSLQVVVADDGLGPSGSGRRSGLANLERRALPYGGHCELVGRPAGGTELRWTIPLP